MDKNRFTEEKFRSSSASKHEDAAMKTMMHFFAEELLPLLGIQGKVASIAPTELMDIRIANFYQDFNFFMEDGSIKHLEFQSSDLTLDDLKRFRSYESVTSYQYKAPVTTYVVCSGRYGTQKHNSQRGSILKGEPILRSELVWLTLTPIMGGSMPIKDVSKLLIKLQKTALFFPRGKQKNWRR